MSSTIENKIVWQWHANQLPDESVVCIQRCSTRQYASFASIGELVRYLQRVPSAKRAYSEYSRQPYRRFFVDYENTKISQVNSLNQIIDNINSILDNFLDFEYDHSPLVYTSSRGTKISYHIVYSFVTHYSVAKKLIKDIRTLEPNCDPCVYGATQHLRLYGCYKLTDGELEDGSIKLMIGEKHVDWDQLPDSLMSNITDFPTCTLIINIPKTVRPKVTNLGSHDGIRQLLEILDPCVPVDTGEGVYGFWLKVGIVLYNHYDGSDYGLDLWDEWSQRDAEKYDSDCCEYKWNTFGSKNTITLGSLRYWAKTHDPDAYKKWRREFITITKGIQDNISLSYINILDKWRDKPLEESDMKGFYSDWQKVLFPMVKGGSIIWCALQDTEIEMFKNDAEPVPRKIFTIHKNVRLPICKLLPLSIFKLYRFPPRFEISCEERVIKENNAYYLNSFTGYVSKPFEQAVTRDEVAIFLDHILYSFANGNEEQAEWIIKWYAWIVQKKGKTKVALGLYSENQQVAGKSLFNQSFATKLLGQSYYYYARSIDNYINDRFNIGQLHKIFVIMDEAKWTGNKTTDDLFKQRITETITNYEVKNGPDFTSLECANYILNTNNLMSVKITKGDRRFAFFHCSETWTATQGGKEYMNRLASAFNDTLMVSKLHKYLLDVDLSGVDLQDSPMTELKQDMMMLALSPVEQWRNYVVSERPFDNYLKHTQDSKIWVPTYVLFENFLAFCQQTNLQNKWITQNSFTIELKQTWYNENGLKHDFYDKRLQKKRRTVGFWIPV